MKNTFFFYAFVRILCQLVGHDDEIFFVYFNRGVKLVIWYSVT